MTKQKISKKVAKQYSSLHKRRVAWFGILVVGLMGIQLVYNAESGTTPQVLGYATSVSGDEMLSATNDMRRASSLSELKISETLSKGAQEKANDMVAHNYWGHIGPNNTAPWAFFEKVGYKYTDAGENLAYGFSSSSEIVSAWMNSPTHKANVLGKYTEVGFGYATGEHYQNGNNTVVVAFYGTPATTSHSNALLSSSSTGGSIAGESQHISGLNIFASGNANWALYASFALIMTAVIGFVATHLELFRLGWYKGKKFLSVHPLFDAVVIVTITSMLFYTAGGFIR